MTGINQVLLYVWYKGHSQDDLPEAVYLWGFIVETV